MGRQQKEISESSVLICGPVRNVAKVILQELQIMANATSSFKETHFLLVESDSSDETVQLLAAEKRKRLNFQFISNGKLSVKIKKRTERIAFCRNIIIDEVIRNSKLRNIDYVMMADLDGMNQLITREKINECWNLDQIWDVLTANQGENYYDIWALRHPLWCPDDCWQLKEKLEPLVGEKYAVNLAVTARQVILDPRFQLIEVDSAFGGFAIYKKEAFISGRYHGLDSNGKEIADHVIFHQEIKLAGYKIFINPALINCAKYPENAITEIPKKSSLIIKTIKKMGLKIFGKKRFNKYVKQLITY